MFVCVYRHQWSNGSTFSSFILPFVCVTLANGQLRKTLHQCTRERKKVNVCLCVCMFNFDLTITVYIHFPVVCICLVTVANITFTSQSSLTRCRRSNPVIVSVVMPHHGGVGEQRSSLAHSIIINNRMPIGWRCIVVDSGTTNLVIQCFLSLSHSLALLFIYSFNHLLCYSLTRLGSSLIFPMFIIPLSSTFTVLHFIWSSSQILLLSSSVSLSVSLYFLLSLTLTFTYNKTKILSHPVSNIH